MQAHDLKENTILQELKQLIEKHRTPFTAILWSATKKCVVARGWDQSLRTPILHPELHALYTYFETVDKFTYPPSSLSLYTTAEPCPMCQSAVIWSEIPSVHFGVSRPFLRKLGLGTFSLRASEIIQDAGDAYEGTVTGGFSEPFFEKIFREMTKQ